VGKAWLRVGNRDLYPDPLSELKRLNNSSEDPGLYPPAEINATHVRPHHTSPPEPFNPTAADHLIKIGKVIAQGLLYLGRALIWIGLTLWSLLSGLFRLLAMAFFDTQSFYSLI
jgi:hypothetical protein